MKEVEIREIFCVCSSKMMKANDEGVSLYHWIHETMQLMRTADNARPRRWQQEIRVSICERGKCQDGMRNKLAE